MTTSTPASCSARTASRDSGRTTSATASAASTRRASPVSSTRYTALCAARSCGVGAECVRRRSGSTPRPPQQRRARRRTARDRRPRARTPRPGSASNRSTRLGELPLTAPVRTIAARDRMLGIRLDRRREPQRFVGSMPGAGGDRDDAELAARQRSGLVEDDGVDVARLLQPAAVAHEQPAARAEASSRSRSPAAPRARARAGRRSRAP